MTKKETQWRPLVYNPWRPLPVTCKGSYELLVPREPCDIKWEWPTPEQKGEKPRMNVGQAIYWIEMRPTDFGTYPVLCSGRFISADSETVCVAAGNGGGLVHFFNSRCETFTDESKAVNALDAHLETYCRQAFSRTKPAED